MVKSLAFVALLLVAPPVAAQVIAIHGNAQKAAYASPAEWLTMSAQCHGPAVDSTGSLTTNLVTGLFGDARINHTHLDWTRPTYGEITGPFVSHFAITLYHTAGHIDGSAGGIGSFANQIVPESIVWDATGTSTPPPMLGNINDVRGPWTGHFTFDPTRPHPSGEVQTKHGWFVGRIVVRTQFDTGANLDTENITNFFALIDPAQPENFPPGEGRIEGAWCTPRLVGADGTPSDTKFGVVRAEYTTFVPIAPIFAPWTATVFPYSYTAQPSIIAIDGVFEQRRDQNFHAGLPGALVATRHFPGEPGQQFPIVWDPAAMGSGTHPTAIIWAQTDGQHVGVWALSVIKLTVGDGVPPPTTCTDPTATNQGAPLPCLFPASPVVTWHTIRTIDGIVDVQQFTDTERRRLCVATKCSEEFMVPR